MLTFPLHNAALDLKGKPPAELPHGLLPVPAEVRQLVEAERAKRPGYSDEAWRRSMNLWAVTWYYDGLGQEVLYRETPQGPEVLAVGFEEIRALTDGMKPEKMAGLQTYEG
jgi:hypothetical protein